MIILTDLMKEGERMTVYATDYIRDVDEGEMYAKLFRGNDGNTYVVKVMSNPTGKRALFNELISYRLAKLMNLPVAKGDKIIFSKKVFKDANLLDEMGIEEGAHYGSLFIPKATRYNKDKLPFCKNTDILSGVIVFDNWITNYDRRHEPQNSLVTGDKPYELILIDHAQAFNGPNWTIKSILPWTFETHLVWGGIYEEFIPFIDNEDPFGNALSTLESITDDDIAAAFGKDLPSEWQVSKEDIKALLFHLIEKKKRVREVIYLLKGNFPIWSRSG